MLHLFLMDFFFKPFFFITFHSASTICCNIKTQKYIYRLCIFSTFLYYFFRFIFPSFVVVGIISAHCSDIHSWLLLPQCTRNAGKNTKNNKQKQQMQLQQSKIETHSYLVFMLRPPSPPPTPPQQQQPHHIASNRMECVDIIKFLCSLAMAAIKTKKKNI